MLIFFIILAIVLIALATTYILIGRSLFKYAIVRRANGSSATKEDLENAGAGEHADEIIKAREDFFNYKYKKVAVRAFDGLKLVGLLYEAPNPKGMIILFHGYRSFPGFFDERVTIVQQHYIDVAKGFEKSGN